MVGSLRVTRVVLVLEEAVRKEPAVRRCKGKCDWRRGSCPEKIRRGWERVRAYSGLCNCVYVVM